jgi:hypothetical protein
VHLPHWHCWTKQSNIKLKESLNEHLQALSHLFISAFSSIRASTVWRPPATWLAIESHHLLC